MVYLNRIYTKGGDQGETSLGDGNRVPKTHPRVVAYGGVDELNSIVGVAIAAGLPSEFAAWLRQVQNDLFDLGADLCVPESETEPEHPPLRITTEQAERLEKWIDDANERLEPLESFILPGGTPAVANLHHARTVCRRVETYVVALSQEESINPSAVIYLNRLSDLLFVLARCSGRNGADDILWVPGESRKP